MTNLSIGSVVDRQAADLRRALAVLPGKHQTVRYSTAPQPYRAGEPVNSLPVALIGSQLIRSTMPQMTKAEAKKYILDQLSELTIRALAGKEPIEQLVAEQQLLVQAYEEMELTEKQNAAPR